MISTTSLFNKGVYKNTVRRFKWGSFLYFVMLFFSVPFRFMTNTPSDMQKHFNLVRVPYNKILFYSDWFVMPFLLAVTVPTVVALLVYNYVHSSKHAIFAHSVPVTRAQNFVSGILASFTLMILPIAANAVILLVLIPFGYGKLLSVSAIALWLIVNTAILFVMFSIATFSAFLTGNSFALVAINAAIHVLPLVFALAVTQIGNTFIYGYSESVAEYIAKYTPILWLANSFHFGGAIFKHGAFWLYVIMAAIFYALAFVLYKKRKIENCGDVAAFAVFKPILKYTVTAAFAIASFAVLKSFELSGSVVFAVAAIICAIVYFACEMVLNKTLRVFGAYKGYLVFALGCTAVILFSAYTGVFGYEKYIPAEENIAEATMCTAYHDEDMPVTKDKGSIKAVTSMHKELLQNIPVTDSALVKQLSDNYDVLQIRYKLNNGKTVNRSYKVSEKQIDKAYEAMFAFEDYKLDYSGIDRLNIDKIQNIVFRVNCGSFDYNFALNSDTKAFLNALKADLKNVTYKQWRETPVVNYSVDLNMSAEENKKLGYFKTSGGQEYHYSFYMSFNSHYKKTYDFLSEKGYIDLAKQKISDELYICSVPVNYNGKDYIYNGVKEIEGDFMFNSSDVVKIDKPDAVAFLDQNMENAVCYDDSALKTGDIYQVFAGNTNEFYNGAVLMGFTYEQLPDYLKQYVKK